MQKKNCRAGKVLLALCLLLASPSLAEEETGGLVAFQEEINGMRFHAMVDTTITEAPVIEGAYWDPANGYDSLAQNLGAYFGVPAALEAESRSGSHSLYTYALGENRQLFVQSGNNMNLYTVDSPYDPYLSPENAADLGEEELSFASHAEIARQLNDLAHATGIPADFAIKDIASVRGAQYLALVNRTKDTYARLGKSFQNAVLPGVSANDEIAYVLSFEQTIGGVPLAGTSTSEAIFTPAGVDSLCLNPLPFVAQSIGEAQPLISYRDAALRFSQWDEHPREWEGEFDQVRLCFVEEIPQSAAAESVRLVPAWEFSGVFSREASGGGKSLLRMTYFVNAITGEIAGQPFTVVVDAD